MSEIKIFKFGGASVGTADGFRNVGKIIMQFTDKPIVIVISALGKTTNALESVVKDYFAVNGQAKVKLNEIKEHHYTIIDALGLGESGCKEAIHDICVEIEWVFDDEPNQEFDFIYDQIVSAGEMMSSKILYYLLKSLNENPKWQDIRDVIITDNTFRDARVDWSTTTVNAQNKLLPQLQNGALIITQGFIGSTTENQTTTLGREGSDYTAAILSYCLNANSMHIWKDVPGVLTGDPKLFDEVTKIPRLSYREATEMTYYGAKVIHPKTIKPLQNKQIPLYVRPFGEPTSEGTIIADLQDIAYPPIIVIEPQQCLIHISTRDFSFVAEHHLSAIFALLAKHRLKVNMMRNTAISFTVCVTQVPERIKRFEDDIQIDFKTLRDEDLELITIRHYSIELLKDMKKNKLILFEEKLSDTVQMVVKPIQSMKRKH